MREVFEERPAGPAGRLGGEGPLGPRSAAPGGTWRHVDADAFRRDVDALRAEATAGICRADFDHLRRVETRGRIATLVGFLTAWTLVNPVSPLLLSFGRFTRWLVAHHVMHRGYDRVPGIPRRYTSKVFARGPRRFVDWFDWIHPDAWHQEHNVLHHYHTGEDHDPDVVERNVRFIHDLKAPKWVKYLAVAATALTWRYTYYAPNTIGVIGADRRRKPVPADEIRFLTIKDVWKLHLPQVRRLWTACYLPYGLWHFAAVPLLFLPLGPAASWTVFWNQLIAECFLNLHSFVVIGPNHTGDDVYRFDYHVTGKDQFYVHQVLGSVNYVTGGDLVDHPQIWLNYQIEHHLFPDLPMTGYRRVRPAVEALCKKHGLPYVQENVLLRFKKLVDVCVGNARMRRMGTFLERGRPDASPPAPV